MKWDKAGETFLGIVCCQCCTPLKHADERRGDGTIISGVWVKLSIKVDELDYCVPCAREIVARKRQRPWYTRLV